MTSSWGAPTSHELPKTRAGKPFYRRWWFIVLVVLCVFAIIGACAPDQTTQNGVEPLVTSTTTSSSTTTTTKPIPSWRNILNVDTDSAALMTSSCTAFENFLVERGDEITERLELLGEASRNAYAAVEFFENRNAWTQVDQLRSVTKRQYDVAEISLRHASSSNPVGKQVTEFLKEVHDVCGLSNQYIELQKSATLLNSKIKTVKALRQNAPWYPKGFSTFNSTIAFRYLKYGSEYKCSYPGATCWGIELVTKNGCNNLYAELTIFDSSERNIDWTNDTASSVRPGEKVLLVFATYEDGAHSGRLSEVSCY